MPVTSSMRAAQEGGNREDCLAAAHQGTRARSGPTYSRTAGRGRGVSPAGRWLTIGARSKGHSRRPLAKSSGQADSRLKCELRVCSGTRMHCNACNSLPINAVPACAAATSVVFEHLKLSVSDLSIGMQADLACRYGAARKRCPTSSSGDARKASDVGSPGSTDMPEAIHPSDEAAKAFRSFRRLRMASATGSPASSEMTQGSNFAGSRAPRAPEDVPMARGSMQPGAP